jgi:hypothetical protein
MTEMYGMEKVAKLHDSASSVPAVCVHRPNFAFKIRKRHAMEIF